MIQKKANRSHVILLILVLFLIHVRVVIGQVVFSELGEMIDVTNIHLLASVEVHLSYEILTIERSLIGLYLDKAIFDFDDPSSFYMASKVWKEFLPDRPSGKYFKYRKILSPKDAPLLVNEESLVKFLIKYQIDRIIIRPDWDFSPRPTEHHQIFFYPRKELCEKFVRDLQTLSFVIKCDTSIHPLDPSLYKRDKSKTERKIKSNSKDNSTDGC